MQQDIRDAREMLHALNSLLAGLADEYPAVVHMLGDGLKKRVREIAKQPYPHRQMLELMALGDELNELLHMQLSTVEDSEVRTRRERTRRRTTTTRR